MRIAIIQSCYIPWKGFFDLIGRCDMYVMYDSAQFVKGHWHNRNRVKTPVGTKWLTIPVKTSGRLGQPIRDVEISEKWAERHWSAISQAYRQAPYFSECADMVREWYEQADRTNNLSQVNAIFIRGIAKFLKLQTRISPDAAYHLHGEPSEKVLTIARTEGAHHYLSGPSAKTYLDETIFAELGIAVEWMSYKAYPEYKQLHGNFDHSVSVIDVLFNTGAAAGSFCKSQA